MAGARPLRILMLTTSYPPAPGVPNGAFVHRLAARLVAAGHEVDVLAPHAEGAESRVEDGVRSHFFRYAPTRLELLAYGPGMVYNLSVDRRRLALLPSFGAAFAIAAARHARRADVVHGHWLPAGMVARVTRRPFVTTVHGSDLALAQRVPRLVRATLSNHVTIAVSDEMRRELAKLAPHADIRVVPPGGVEFPARPYSDATPGRLLFVGRLVDVKGVDTLMSAWPAIRAANPHATLDVVGVGPLAELVHGEGVRLLGRVRPNEIAGLYADAAAVVVPSRRDSFSLACLEGMATARPVICTPVGDMATRVRDGVDGLVVRPDDPAAVAAAAGRLLADPAAAATMGLEARRRAEARYSWDVIVREMLAAYEAAITSRGSATCTR
jgi:glycosyltransferase involved in cell wall biosynthesis